MGEEGVRTEKYHRKRKWCVRRVGGFPRYLAADSGPIVLLGNEGTKGTGGVHLILAGGRSLRSRETPARSFICCSVSLGRH